MSNFLKTAQAATFYSVRAKELKEQFPTLDIDQGVAGIYISKSFFLQNEFEHLQNYCRQHQMGYVIEARKSITTLILFVP